MGRSLADRREPRARAHDVDGAREAGRLRQDPLRTDAEGLLPEGVGRRRRHRSAVELLCRRTRPGLCRAAGRSDRRRRPALRAVEVLHRRRWRDCVGIERRPCAGRRGNHGRVERPVRRRRVRGGPGRLHQRHQRDSGGCERRAGRRARRRHVSESGRAERPRGADPERGRRLALVGRDCRPRCHGRGGTRRKSWPRRAPDRVPAAHGGRTRAAVGRRASWRVRWDRRSRQGTGARARGDGGRRAFGPIVARLARGRRRGDDPPAVPCRRRRRLGPVGANPRRLPGKTA